MKHAREDYNCIQDPRHHNILDHRAKLSACTEDPLKPFKGLLAMAAKKKVKSSKAGIKQKMGTMPKKKGVKTKGQKGYI